MVFFWKLKAGEYGSFYGVVDPLKITEALGVFVQWRNDRVSVILRKMKRAADLKKEIELEEMRLRGEFATAEQIRATITRILKK